MLSTRNFIVVLDISLIYHIIRGQATIKLYVIYNVLEVSINEPLSKSYWLIWSHHIPNFCTPDWK